MSPPASATPPVAPGRTALIVALWAFVALLGLRFVFPGPEKPSQPYCDDVPCFHLEARLSTIRSQAAQTHDVSGAGKRYLLIGDSITEGLLPESLCDAVPLNAGIGGATTATWKSRAQQLTSEIHPDFVVLALGTNDALRHRGDGFEVRLRELVASLAPSKVIVMPPPPSPSIPDIDAFVAAAEHQPTAAAPLASVQTVDGIHLTAADYVAWRAALAHAAKRNICP